MTERETQVIELAIKWVTAKYSVEEAIVYQNLRRAVRMLIKERRDQAEEASGEQPGRRHY